MQESGDKPDIEGLIQRELRFFPSEEMKTAFLGLRVSPEIVVEKWNYGEETHDCWIVARDPRSQIVYCRTGFGPSFPWSCQVLGETNLGMDGQWCAYLMEAFAAMWKGNMPEEFELMGPGERQGTTTGGTVRRYRAAGSPGRSGND